MYIRFAALLLLYCTGSPLFADAVLYECRVTQKKEGVDWISDQVGLVLKSDSSVIVLDAVILHFLGGPIPATRVRNTASKLDVRWTISGARDDGNQAIPNFDYNAVVDKKTGRFSLFAKPENYSNRFRGKGSCVLKTAE